MERVIVAEVLGRRGDVVQRLRLERFPATIGRAWTNDLVLGDPAVDAHHARIALDEQGAAFLEDLGSLNGLHVGGARETVRRVALDGMATVRVGRTVLRIGALETPVPPAVPELAPTGRLAWLIETPAAIGMLVLATTVLVTLSTWLGSYESKSTATVTGTAVGVIALAASWAGIWSLVGRLSVQRFRFWQHVALTFLALFCLFLLSSVDSYTGFLFPTASLLAFLGAALGATIFIALIAAQLGLVSAMRRRRRVGAGVVVTVLLVALGSLTTKAAKNQLEDESDVRIAVSLKPLPARMIPAGSVDDFVGSTNGLKKEVDGLLKE